MALRIGLLTEGGDGFVKFKGGKFMGLILLIIVLVLVFGGGSGVYYGQRYGWGGPHYMGGGLGLILLIIVILFLFGGLGGGWRL